MALGRQRVAGMMGAVRGYELNRENNGTGKTE
jgi:hypothetical protein